MELLETISKIDLQTSFVLFPDTGILPPSN
jgi:hypothetical protein